MTSTTLKQAQSPGTAPPPPRIQTVSPAGPWSHLKIVGHVPALDGLRGLAITLVLLYHFVPSGQGHSWVSAVTKLIASAGWRGVDLFFVLSGFLITGILLDAKGTPRYFTTFYARRALRIFPLYYGVLFVCLVIVPALRPASPEVQRILHDQGWLWLYTSNFKMWLSPLDKPFTAGWIEMDHFWSLAVEEHFYLVWPLVVLLFSRRGMLVVCTVIAAIALGLRGWFYLHGDDSGATFLLTPCRMDELALGGLLAVLARGPAPKIRPSTLAVLVMGLSALAMGLTWNTRLQKEAIGGTLLGVFFAASLMLLLTQRPASPLRLALANRPLLLLGKYSYAIYVLHPFVLAVLNAHLSYRRLGGLVHSGAVGVLLFLALGFALSVAAGWLSWHLFEKHFLKLKKYFGYVRTPSAAGYPKN